MQKYKDIQFFVYFFVLLSLGSSSGSYKIDHLEPPFWWAGMVDNRLQILVHGENISELAKKYNRKEKHKKDEE